VAITSHNLLQREAGSDMEVTVPISRKLFQCSSGLGLLDTGIADQISDVWRQLPIVFCVGTGLAKM
jgi:hypothetical protein